MPVQFDTSEDVASGAFLKEPGTYHLFVHDSQEVAQDKDGKPMDAFRLSCQVLAGTVAQQEKKEVDLLVFHPSASHKDGGDFAKRRITRALIALAKMQPGDRGKRLAVDLTPDTTSARQFIATLKKVKDKDYLELNGTDIYHVDDPHAAAFPKSDKFLKMLPAEQRFNTPELQKQFREMYGQDDSAAAGGSAGSGVAGAVNGGPANGNGGGNGNGSSPAKKPATVVDLDDV